MRTIRKFLEKTGRAWNPRKGMTRQAGSAIIFRRLTACTVGIDFLIRWQYDSTDM
jgi:hypothetical protein